MRRLSALIVLSIWYTGAAATVCRGGQEDGFAKFYADFQAALKAGDKERVASMTRFDDFYWEATDALRQVKTREAFLKDYDKMFAPAIKNKIATTKPKKEGGGYYQTGRHTTNFEYGFDFKQQRWQLQIPGIHCGALLKAGH